MDEYPPVIVLLVTYRRLALALETIKSVKERLIYPNIGFHIADDGSGSEYVDRLVNEIGAEYSIEVTDAKRAGVGASMNMGIEAVLNRADLWLHLEDDWVLPRPLDLVPCVELLVANVQVGMVRLGRLSGGLRGVTFAGANKLWWEMERNFDSYVFTGNPSLRHRRFRDAYGAYAAGLKPGETELNYCNAFNTHEGPSIVYPAWLTYLDTFQHIGDSQSFKYYMENEGLSGEDAAEIFAKMDSEST